VLVVEPAAYLHLETWGDLAAHREVGRIEHRTSESAMVVVSACVVRSRRTSHSRRGDHRMEAAATGPSRSSS
jgi:hypothetical protein